MVANSIRDGGDSASPGDRPWPWLLVSLLGHAALLGPAALPLPPPAATPTPPPSSVQWRWAAPAAAPSTAPSPVPSAAPDRAPPPVAEAPRPATTPPRAPPPAVVPAPTGLALPPSAHWPYRLRWQGEQGDAWLRWEQDGDRYRLALERQTDSRVLPTWRSEGVIDPQHGLRPERFSTQGPRGERPLPVAEPGVQDRLSWMLQAAALAARQGLRPGEGLRLQVIGWRGGVQTWELRAERDDEAPGLLRLRRLPPEGGALEQLLWLDPADHYRPVRLRVRYDAAERWELVAGDRPTPP